MKEKIVAVIESYFQDRDDILTYSSIKIPDIINELEEVDVLYVSLEDPTRIYSFVEVRDRSNNIGRQYIQEIIGKKASLNIDTCTIVSTKGFAPNAVKLAERHGIKTRKLVQNPHAGQDWYRSEFMTIRKPLLHFDKCSMSSRVGQNVITFAFEGSKVAEKVVTKRFSVSDEITISAIDIFHRDFYDKNIETKKVFEDIPRDGMLYALPPIVLQYNPSNYFLSIDDLPNDFPNPNNESMLLVEIIIFYIKAREKIFVQDITERYDYIDAANKKTIAQCLLTSFLVDEQTWYAALVKYAQSNEGWKIGGALFH